MTMRPDPATGLQRQARWIFLLAATAVGVWITWRMVQPFFSVLVWSGVLVLLFLPLHLRISRRLGRPSLAAAISVLIVSVTVVLPAGFVAAAVGAELARFAQGARERLEPFLADPTGGGRLQLLLDWFRIKTGLVVEVSPEKVADLVTGLSQTVLKGTFNVLGGVLGGFGKLFFVLFTLYYLFRDAEKIRAGLPDRLPVSHAAAERLIRRTGEIIQASVNGNLAIAALQGSLGGLMFWFLGLPSPLLWGVVMTVLSMLPLVGAFVVWLPVALWLLMAGSWGKALVLALWGALVMGTIDNVLRPWLVGERAQMHELTIFFSVLGGIQLFGMLGFLAGPVVVAITRSLGELFLHGDEEPPPAAVPAGGAPAG